VGTEKPRWSDRDSGEGIVADTRSNKPQSESPSYRLPVLDPDFLLGDSTRGVRFLLEYQKAEDALRLAGIRSTVVVFGSARVREDSPGDHGRWYAEARRFGRIVSELGGAIDHGGQRINVIATGGGPGIMEAANRGATEAGAASIGFNITLPREQEPNAWTTPELTFRFHYFAMRKMHLAMRAAALVVFPGGFGTFDELFEILTLRQTHKMPPIPVVLAMRPFWDSVIRFDELVRQRLIEPRDLSLFSFAGSADDTWEVLAKAGLQTPVR
jgi:uncharacterized protein (TIGR00730 family)